ncbi:MAG: hypothetical protein AMXMBFR64_06180 [Myxococcales bacterium]
MNRVRLSTLALGASLLIAAGSPALANHGPSTVVVMETGTIRVQNESSFPMQVRLDGAHVGQVAAGSHLVLTSTPAGAHRVVASYPGREDVPSTTFNLHVMPGQVVHAVIRQVAGSVRVVNPNAFPVQVVLSGQPRGSLGPGASLLLAGVPAGRHEVVVQAHGAAMAGQVRVLPGRVAQFEPALFTGSLRIHNDNRFAVKVLVDGRPAGKLVPGATRVIDGLVPGNHTVEVRGHHGLRMVHTATVRASKTTTWAFAAPRGPHHKVVVAPAGPAYKSPPKGVVIAKGPKKGGWKKH